MAAGGHLGYWNTPKNNRFCLLGPMKVCAKYLVDWSITVVCSAITNPFYGRGRGCGDAADAADAADARRTLNHSIPDFVRGIQ